MKHKFDNNIITIPNVLSFFRILLIPIMVWMYLERENYLWTAGLLILSGLTDIVDGFIARHFDMGSDLGKILDPIADKLTQATMLFLLITRFPFMLVPFVLLILKEVFSGITGYLIIQKTDNVDSAEWHGKVTTALLYITMFIHVIWYDIPSVISNILIVSCVVMMVVSLVLYGVHRIIILTNTD